MTSNSSGNLLADRRFGVAEALAAEGDHDAAADLLEQTLELVPQWAPAWLALGLARERIGQISRAAAAFERGAGLDRDGSLGAALHLARIMGDRPAAMPDAFVRGLFDAYADRFDAHLTTTLNYTGPAVVAEALRRVEPEPLQAVLDLGCGTGLMARAVADRTMAIDGVDLAPRMIELARATGLYRRAMVGEIVAFLTDQAPGSYHAVLAADVLVYLGDLRPLLTQAGRALEPGGLLAFTVQRRAGDGYALGADMRFHHGEAYVANALAAAGLVSCLSEPVSTRHDRGVPVPGLVVVARRP